MAKYLACRESPARRKLFRQTRKAIGDQSAYAQKQMIDAKGVLNPGLMPQKLEDLNLLAPARDRGRRRAGRALEPRRRGLANQTEFRTAVLRYATSKAHRDPASTGLWPEVVYPLIERAAGIAGSAVAPRRSGITSADESSASPTPAWCSTG